MAVSRPLILALLAAILCAMTFYAATGAQRSSGVSSAAAPAPPVAEPARERSEPARERSEPARERSEPARQRAERASERSQTARQRSEPTRERDRAAGGERRAAGKQRNDARSRSDRRRRATPAPLPAELRVEGLPRPVARALAAKRTLVLFFRQGAADDALVADSVDAVRGLRRVSVFSAPIQRLGRYRAVIGGLGLAQAPAIAVVGRDRQARVIEGFVDPGTLRQLVLDVR